MAYSLLSKKVNIHCILGCSNFETKEKKHADREYLQFLLWCMQHNQTHGNLNFFFLGKTILRLPHFKNENIPL